MRELRALFEEAKKEAAKDEPDGVKLKALLADASEMVKTFAGLDPMWQGVQRVAAPVRTASRRMPPCPLPTSSPCGKPIAATSSRRATSMPPWRPWSQRPYVNHVPTMTGGVGHDQLKRFYKYHFIGGNPPDTELKPISRTVGADQIVDELLFCFTHTSEIDWMLPGIAPTGKRVEIPLVAIVRFEGDKVAHEHIYWDQASVLVQVGLLDPKGLPVAGIETARKVADNALPSNELMTRWAASAGKPI